MSAALEAVAREWLDAVAAADAGERLSRIAAHDVTIHDVTGNYTGLDTFVANVVLAVRATAPGLRLVVDECISDDESVAVHWHAEFTPPSRLAERLTGTNWFRFEQGRVAEMWAFWEPVTPFDELRGQAGGD